MTLLAAGGYADHWRRWRRIPSRWRRWILFAVIFRRQLQQRAVRRDPALADQILAVALRTDRHCVLTDEKWRRRALLAWIAAMLLTLALSYLHALWVSCCARATREHEQGDHYIFS